MKHVALLIALLIPATVSAQGLNLSWNGCGSQGVQNVNFACNTNSRAPFVATGSFVTPISLGSLWRHEAVLDVVSAGTTLPAWWEFFNASACRRAALTLGWSSHGVSHTCYDYWPGLVSRGGLQAYRTIHTLPPASGPNRARIVLDFSADIIPTGLLDGEIHAFDLRIDASSTLGAGACTGCGEAVCIVFNSIVLDQSPGFPPLTLSGPAQRNWITWQGGTVDGGCPAATPARNRTWGQVKSLYR